MTRDQLFAKAIIAHAQNFGVANPLESTLANIEAGTLLYDDATQSLVGGELSFSNLTFEAGDSGIRIVGSGMRGTERSHPRNPDE